MRLAIGAAQAVPRRGDVAENVQKTSCVIRGEGASWSVWLSSDGAGYRQGSTDVDV